MKKDKKNKFLKKMANILLLIRQNKILFIIYALSFLIFLIFLDYVSGFIRFYGWTDASKKYFHLLPFVDLYINPNINLVFGTGASIHDFGWGKRILYFVDLILISVIAGHLLTLLTVKLKTKFKSKKKPLLFIFIPFFAVFSLSAFALSSNNKTPISWTPKKIQEEVFVGTTKVFNIQFVSKESLENVELWTTSKLKDCLTITPNLFNTIEKNKIIRVKIIASIPFDTSVKSCGGTVHLKSTAKSKETYPQTLKVVLNVKEPTAEELPSEITLPSSDRIYTDPATGNEFVKDEILVGFKDGIDETIIKNIVSEIGGVLIGGNKPLNLYQIKVSITNVDELNTLIQALEAKSEVVFASHSWLEKLQYE